MNVKALISQNSEFLQSEVDKILAELEMIGENQPDLLLINNEKTLGVEVAKRIKSFLSLKPTLGNKRAVVVLEAERLTPDAQNALLKTIEELNDNLYIVLAASTDNTFLPTVLSRIETHRFFEKGEKVDRTLGEKFLRGDIQSRFSLVEKTDNKDLLFYSIAEVLREVVEKEVANVGYLEALIEAEKQKKSNVNNRAILEHLSLILPKIG